MMFPSLRGVHGMGPGSVVEVNLVVRNPEATHCVLLTGR